MKKLLLLALVFIITGCDIVKEASKTKSDTAFKEQIETKIFRKGDTVRYVVPVVRYKDTTIYTVNRQGTTLKTVYDKTGNLASVDCFASAIEEIRNENREFMETIKEKESKKEEKANMDWVLYIVIGLVIVVMFGMWLIFKKISDLNYIK